MHQAPAQVAVVRLAVVGAAHLERPGRELAEEHLPARRRGFNRAAAGRAFTRWLRRRPSPAFPAPSPRRHPEPAPHVCEDVLQLLLGALGAPAFGFEAERHVATAAVRAEAQGESAPDLPLAGDHFSLDPLRHLGRPLQPLVGGVSQTELEQPARELLVVGRSGQGG